MELPDSAVIGNTAPDLFLLVFFCFCLWILTGAVYRLWFSPISHFPGPKIAALTWWYEFYHDAIRGGQYIWEIEKMHRRYGPIIRINPEELHVSDPDFYAVLYSSNRRNKTVQYSNQFGTPDASIGTIDHSVHRVRRAALNPFFSKASVYRLEPVIQEKVDEMLLRLEGFRRNPGEVIPLTLMFSAFTNDIVMEYSFARCDHRLQHPEFDPVFHEVSAGTGDMNHWAKHMNWIFRLVQSVPPWMARYLDEKMAKLIAFQAEMGRQIKSIQNGQNKHHETASHRTIFHDMLESNLLPDSDKQLSRMAQEGQVVVGAGTETTSWTLSVGMFYILSNPSIRSRLEEELEQNLFPGLDPRQRRPLKLVDLERLPYLTACIQESLRLSYGVTSRLARIAPDQALSLKLDDGDGHGHEIQIPPGVPVSMTSVLLHRDPKIFPCPEEFRPERWLENPRLDRYLVAFTKGTRQCLGINLAYAELYMGLGGIFRWFGRAGRAGQQGSNTSELVLYETSHEDVETVADMFLPGVRKGSKGVRAVFR